MKKELKRKRLSIEKDCSIDAIALVEFPAIEVNFMKFGKQVKLSNIDIDKRLVTGPILIPDKDIYRRNDFEEWYVYFEKEDVRQIGQQYMMANKNDAVNLEHEQPIETVSLIESWFVDFETDKIYSLGFSKDDVPIGSWVGTMYVKDDTLWEKIKAGEFNGFSIEGMFVEKFSKGKDILDEIINILEN